MCNRNTDERYASSRSKRRQNFTAPEFACRVLCPFFFGLEFVVDRSVQKRRWVWAMSGLVFVLAGSAVQAQAISSTGLWATDARVMLNGVDSVDLMTKYQIQVANTLPAPLKAQALISLNQAKTRGTTTVCITPQNVASVSTPTAIFTTFSRMNARCTLVKGTATALTQNFTGRCDDPASFTGNVRGTITLRDNLRSWVSETVGFGLVPDVALAALKLPSKTLVRMQSFTASYLSSPTCPVATVASVTP
ncbi:DUF3617 family protein [Aquabacterium sp.]|uniref:DUF3617 family protein n=1 Tax=Aquabacterium sp. TaxID=1872578 RepID=UPI002489D82B|nr:DUF3617 family protein [Aquabacterium sp.]MDI1260334.1 DUF3617 family protein [Aquabacterium sp.]